MFQQIDKQRTIRVSLNALETCDDTESVVEGRLICLLKDIARQYNLTCVIENKLKYCVGGILADQDLAVVGITDNSFLSHQDADQYLLVTEAKTKRTFPRGRQWYKKSRAIQSISALRASGGAPTLLYNQAEFKLLVVDDGHAFAYPAEFETGLISSKDFLLALAYVLKAGNKACPEPEIEFKFATPERVIKRKKEIPSAEQSFLPTDPTGKRRLRVPRVDYSSMYDELAVRGFRIDSLWSIEYPDSSDQTDHEIPHSSTDSN